MKWNIISKMKRNIITIISIAFCLTSLSAQNIKIISGPWVFKEYKSLNHKWKPDSTLRVTPEIWRAEMLKARLMQDSIDDLQTIWDSETNSLFPSNDEISQEDILISDKPDSLEIISYDPEYPLGNYSAWLQEAAYNRKSKENMIYSYMVNHPEAIQYAVWELPERPVLPEDDNSFLGYLRTLYIPQPSIEEAEITDTGIGKRINWLHTFNLALQLSQAYLSPNWYQGGNDYLAFFGNFLWDVQLNNVYYPNLIFQSTVSYKLGINSTLNDQYHKYSVSQELFQYNLKFGYKAAKKWYYSFTTVFKTQFLHAYPANSNQLMAAFLSPGELNLGIGMTYNYEKPDKTMTFSMSLAPLSYNLKTCIDDKVDHTQLSMNPGQRIKNEYGSNAEFNFYWAFRDNISYKSRLFLFTDYRNFTGDWENSFNFQFSKLFSTQLYLYFRYDSASDSHIAPKWKKWMLKEILSVGLSYTFSTKSK